MGIVYILVLIIILLICFKKCAEKQTDKNQNILEDTKINTHYFYLHQYKDGKRRTLYWDNPQGPYSQKHLNFLNSELKSQKRSFIARYQKEHLFSLHQTPKGYYLKTHHIEHVAPFGYFIDLQQKFFDTNKDIYFIDTLPEEAVQVKALTKGNYNIEINGKKFFLEFSDITKPRQKVKSKKGS